MFRQNVQKIENFFQNFVWKIENSLKKFVKLGQFLWKSQKKVKKTSTYFGLHAAEKSLQSSKAIKILTKSEFTLTFFVSTRAWLAVLCKTWNIIVNFTRFLQISWHSKWCCRCFLLYFWIFRPENVLQLRSDTVITGDFFILLLFFSPWIYCVIFHISGNWGSNVRRNWTTFCW